MAVGQFDSIQFQDIPDTTANSAAFADAREAEQGGWDASALQLEVSRLQAENATLRDHLELSRHRVSATEVHLAAHIRDLAQAKSSASSAAAGLAESGAEAKRLKAEIHAASAALQAVEEALRHARAQSEQLDGDLAAAVKARDDGSAACAKLERDNALLRHDLAESANGRELLELRARIAGAEVARVHAERLREQAESDLAKIAEADRRQREELEILLRRCLDAERRADAVSDVHLQKENEVFRGIIDRQKVELERHFGELLRLRTARFGLRIAYLLFGASLAGLGVLAIKVIPKALQMSGF